MKCPICKDGEVEVRRGMWCHSVDVWYECSYGERCFRFPEHHNVDVSRERQLAEDLKTKIHEMQSQKFVKYSLQTILSKTINEKIYSLAPYVNFKITKLGDSWILSRGQFFDTKPFSLIGVETYGGTFKTLEDAEREYIRIVVAYHTPLTRKQIVSWFDMKFLKKEEEGELLTEFREALINRERAKAARIYNKLSSWSKEAIPDIVVYQLQRGIFG